MFRAFWAELAKGIFDNKLKILRMIGIMIIPLVYAFIYIFAYFNPFADTSKLDIRVLVAKDDQFGRALVERISKKIDPIKVGQIKFKISINKYVKNPNDIYIDTDKYNSPEKWNDQVKHLAQESYGTFVINPYTDKGNRQTLTSMIGTTFIEFDDIFKNPKLTLSEKINLFINKMQKADKGEMQFYSNYQKNYIMGMGMDLSSSLSPTFQRVFNEILITNNSSVQNYIKNDKKGGDDVVNDFKKFITSLKDSPTLNSDNGIFGFINVHSDMEKFAKYGYGLAPFFISIGVWVGVMGITLGVHGKIYSKTISPVKTYFGKLLLMILLCLIQTTILFSMLSIIGFSELGIANLSFYWFSSFITGAIFCIIIQSIRFMIPHRMAGILVILGLVIIQMAASGGIFPTSLEFKVFQVIHPFVPFTYTVNIFRQASFDTDVINWLINVGYLSIFALPFIIAGPIIYNIRKKKYMPLKNNPMVSNKKGGL